MTYFVIPSRRTRQPQNVAAVNRAFVGPNDFVFNAATPRINLASGKPISISYAVDNPFPVTRYGIGYQPIDDQFDGIQVVQSASFYGGPGFTFATAVQGALFGNHILADVGAGGVCGYGISFADVAYAPDGRGIPKIGVTFYGVAGYASSYVSTPADGLCFVVTGRTGRIAIFVNGALLETISAGTYIPNNGYSARYGAVYESINTFRGAASHYFALDRELPDTVAAEWSANPWSLFSPDPRRIYFASGGGATIITTSGAASLVARAAVAVAATKTAAVASRATIAGTASTTSIRTNALVAKANSAGTAATATIRSATVSARAAGTGTAATTTLRTGIAAGRLVSGSTTTYAAIIAGAFTAAGRTTARGTAAYTSTHAATAAAAATATGATAATSNRTGIAAARLDARAAVTAAALVAGTVTTTAAAQISARASVSNTTDRVAAVAAMLALRGAAPEAPDLPVTIPPSTRTLSVEHARLGLSPVAPAKPRLG